jgi:uncharacterized coiled-coil protein SlyX
MTNTKKDDKKDEFQLKNLTDVKEEVTEHEQEINQLQKQVKQVKKQVSPDDEPQGGLAEGEINKSAPPANPGALIKRTKKKSNEDQQGGLEEGEINNSAPPAGFV